MRKGKRAHYDQRITVCEPFLSSRHRHPESTRISPPTNGQTSTQILEQSSVKDIRRVRGKTPPRALNGRESAGLPRKLFRNPPQFVRQVHLLVATTRHGQENGNCQRRNITARWVLGPEGGRDANRETRNTKKKKNSKGKEEKRASTRRVAGGTTHLDVDQIRVVGCGRCRLHPGQRGRQLPKQGLHFR